MELIITNKKGVKFTVLYDECDAFLIKNKKWWVHRGKKTFYAITLIDGKPTLMHRFLLKSDCLGKSVDHKNGNGLDNRRENIRVCTALQNNMNRSAFKNNSVGIKGVCVTGSGRYMARITIKSRCIYIGTFNTNEDAAAAYDLEAKKRFGEFAKLNFPEQG